MTTSKNKGFTLIELSIVLVIIGLIVGGVLVGRDLISAAGVRSQISQIEKYQTAANTFRVKYGYLPGDIPNPYAGQFGFATRGPYVGQGDGNGIISSNANNYPDDDCLFMSGNCPLAGEEGMFWVDLSVAKLVDGSFSSASPTVAGSTMDISGTAIQQYLPAAKIGGYVYVWNGGYGWLNGEPDNKNYFAVTGLNAYIGYTLEVPTLTVAQANSIDKKMDDGLPQYGNVLALTSTAAGYPWASGDFSVTSGYRYSTGNGAYDLTNSGPVTTTSNVSTPGSATTCYDNGGVSNTIEKYSISQNNGRGVNCWLSFRFQ